VGRPAHGSRILLVSTRRKPHILSPSRFAPRQRAINT
jgi:hypothetical protein